MSEGLPEVAPLPLKASGVARIRHWIRQVLGLDRAVGFTVLARFWSSAAGPFTVVLIARFLPPAEQVYYYTFGSLVALQEKNRAIRTTDKAGCTGPESRKN